MAPDEVAYGMGQALFATRFFDAQSGTPTPRRGLGPPMSPIHHFSRSHRDWSLEPMRVSHLQAALLFAGLPALFPVHSDITRPKMGFRSAPIEPTPLTQKLLRHPKSRGTEG